MTGNRLVIVAAATLTLLLLLSCTTGSSDVVSPDTPDADNSPTSAPAPTSTTAPAASTLEATIQTPSFVNSPDCDDLERNLFPLADVKISSDSKTDDLVVEIASSQAQKAQGLMCRSEVPAGTGMLFKWDQERSGGFWMSNTYVPLEILYFGASDGSITLRQMTPCPRRHLESDSAWQNRCADESQAYQPGILYTTALELPLGWLEETGFDVSGVDGFSVTYTDRK